MFGLIVRIAIRKLLVHVKIFGRRRSVFLVVAPLLVSVVVLWPTCWWFAVQTSKALLPLPPPTQSLDHYRRNRSLQHYISHIEILIEPSTMPCGSLDEVPVIVLVTSSPPRFDQRQAVRNSWAKHQPTYFVMGLYGRHVDEQLVNNYVEAKQYSDLIVFDFHDHYQNLTLKTALMMKWTLDRCPQAQFLLKTDDDVLVNPWTLKKVLKANEDAQLVGYSRNDTQLHRDEYNKWYIPRWLLRQDNVSQYLSGTGYLISGECIENILKKAYQVPLVNLEDVYFTYLVAHQELGYTLTHDSRLSPYKPWLKLACAYWDLASVHSLGPQEMVTAWNKINSLVSSHDKPNSTDNVCSYFRSLFSDYKDMILF